MPGLSEDPRCDETDAPSHREWRPGAERGARRRQRNRDAARKSRQKTTEWADQLHQELQRLEQDNSSLQKEISALQREMDYYSSALEKHAPHCCLNKNPNDTIEDNTSSLSSIPTGVPPVVSHNDPVSATSVPSLQALKSDDLPKAVSTSLPKTSPDRHTPTQTSHAVPTPVSVPLSLSTVSLNLRPETSITPSLFLHSTTGLDLHTTHQVSLHVPSSDLLPQQMSYKGPILSTSTPSLHTHHQVSHKGPIYSTSCLGLRTTHQMSHSVQTPIPSSTLGSPQMSPNVPHPSSVPPHTLHTPSPMSDSRVNIVEKSESLLTPTSMLSTLLPVVSAGPDPPSVPVNPVLPPNDLLTPGPGVCSLLSDDALDVTLFSDPMADVNLVQLLEDNDWILNVQ